MTSYRLRIRLPDRPGALGLVASRIGSVGADIVSIDILQRSDGLATDDFVVELGDGQELMELLKSEIYEVDGVTVEDISLVRPEPAGAGD